MLIISLSPVPYMDPYSIFTLILSFLFILAAVITKTRKPKPNSKLLPPGPWKLPIIGSMHHLVGALPHRAFYDLSNKFGAVMHLKIGEIDHVIISSREAAKEIMKTNDLNFASRPDIVTFKTMTYGGKDIVFAPYGDYWRQLRKICVLELFSAKRVKSFTSLREEEVCKLISNISLTGGSSSINLSKIFLTLTNTVVTRATYGDKCRQQERFISTIEELSVLASGFTIAELYPSIKFLDIVSRIIKFKADRVHRNIDSIIDETIREHQMKSHEEGDKKECLLDVLLRIKEHGDLEIPLTMDNVKAVIFDIFSAGTETSATLMDWTMVELMRNPNVMEKAQTEVRQILKGKEKIKEHDVDEHNYLKLVIKETLRLHPPLPLLLPRVCAETCEVSGYTIEAGNRIIINVWALGRDPRYWDDAESFIPERFEDNELDFKGNSYEYLPFGSGRRICPGISFSQATVELVLAQLLFYFNWELPEGMQVQDLDMTEAFGVSGRRKSDLLVLARLHGAEAFQSDC